MSDNSNPVRVLHVIDSLVAGGKERQLIELLKGLRAQEGIACELVVMSNEVQYDSLWSLGVKVHLLRRRMRYDPMMFAELNAIARRSKPSIIHSWNSMCSVYGAPTAKLVGAKFINGFVRAAPPGLTMRDPDFFRGKLIMPFCDAVVGNSEAGLQAYAIPAQKGVCIHNGFDIERLSALSPADEIRQALGIETDHVVGMVGAFSVWKDYATFLKAATRVVSVRDDVTFLAVGDGPNREAIAAQISPDLRRRFKFAGRRSDVESIVNIFSIGVLTSTMGEGFSNAIMEYMALGKPVIATDCGGNRELIAHGETGYLIGLRDSESLAGNILTLLDNPDLASQLGERGRNRIAQEFSLNCMTDSYVRLYRDILS